MKYMIDVRGRQHTWGVYINANQVAEMRDDGVEVIEVHNSIPMWAVELGLTKVWAFVQDVWDAPSRLWRGMK
jgi:hypothetical protein